MPLGTTKPVKISQNLKSMTDKSLLRTSIIGTVVAALCCFTPVLAVIFSVVGLSALVGYIDYVLFPALGFFILLTFNVSKNSQLALYLALILSQCPASNEISTKHPVWRGRWRKSQNDRFLDAPDACLNPPMSRKMKIRPAIISTFVCTFDQWPSSNRSLASFI